MTLCRNVCPACRGLGKIDGPHELEYESPCSRCDGRGVVESDGPRGGQRCVRCGYVQDAWRFSDLCAPCSWDLLAQQNKAREATS